MSETVEIPFVTIGNRRGLTSTQLVQHPYIREFYERFRDHFEVDANIDAVLFIEPGTTPPKPSKE